MPRKKFRSLTGTPALSELRYALDARLRIGELIKAAREEQSFSAAALADALGVPRARLSEWERGKVEPRSYVLEKIVGLLTAEASAPVDMMLRELGGYAERNCND
jgi:transcriptional regulator with XRE-family HTH domain